MANIPLIGPAWENLPSWAKSLFGFIIIFGTILIFFYKKFKIFFKDIYGLTRNFYFMIKLKLLEIKEIKRLETNLNWKKDNSRNKRFFDSDKIIIKNVYNDEEETHDTKSFKQSLVFVIKKKLSNDKSENLLSCVIQMVTYDYLMSIRKYLSPELSAALINTKIVEILEEFKEYKIAKKFSSSIKLRSEKIASLEVKINELKYENLFDQLYLNYLIQLKDKKIKKTGEVKKEAEEMLIWLNKYEKRLISVSDFKYFPKTTFLYVRVPDKDINKHVKKAIEKFEDEKSDIVVIGGWSEQLIDINGISRFLHKKYKYYNKLHLTGYLKDVKKGKIRKRVNKIHTKNKRLHLELF